ncbi:MAG: exonuclease subunit SbcD [Clostridiales bacterium]|jgi:exonuclease SbcD|nr:exonuclease subunit SbcD [Clostridiales bacterium]
MRILHTSDWHLGKHLEMYSRLPEQEEFIGELVEIVESRQVDLILIAGDVYDTANPPAEAEHLFYRSLLRLSDGGRRPVVVIAGNHDSPERLAAAGTLAAQIGVFIIGLQRNFADGALELSLNGETAVILTMPYPSEKRLNEVFAGQNQQEELQKSYSEKIGGMFTRLSEKYRDDTINLAMGHFYVRGGESSGSEREIQLGGSYAVDPAALPSKAQYIAMGHLHRPQSVAGTKRAFYSGSPIQYSKSEIGYAKCVYLAEIHPGGEPEIEKIYLRNYKPVEVWKAQSVQDALELCERHAAENTWVFMEIKTDKPLLPSEIKLMKSLKKDIVEICPLLEAFGADMLLEAEEEKSLEEEFRDFYQETRGAVPTENLVSCFLSLSAGEDEL